LKPLSLAEGLAAQHREHEQLQRERQLKELAEEARGRERLGEALGSVRHSVLGAPKCNFVQCFLAKLRGREPVSLSISN